LPEKKKKKEENFHRKIEEYSPEKKSKEKNKSENLKILEESWIDSA